MQTSRSDADYAEYKVSLTTTRIKPMQTSETMDVAVLLFKRHGALLLTLTLPSVCSILLGIGLIGTVIVPSAGTSQYSDAMSQIKEFAIWVGVGMLICLPVASLGFARLMTICHGLVRMHVFNEEITEPRLRRYFQANIGRARMAVILAGQSIGLMLVIGAIVLALAGLGAEVTSESELWPGVLAYLGISVLAIAALVALFKFSSALTLPSIVIEEQISGRAVKARHKFLMQTLPAQINSSPPFSSALVNSILVLVLLALGFALVSNVLDLESYLRSLFGPGIMLVACQTALALAPYFIATWLTLPFLGVVGSLAYFERRARLEGLDIEILSSKISASRRA